jgi:hypothetical protein
MGGLFKGKKLNWLWRFIRQQRDRAIEQEITRLVERRAGQTNPAVRQLLDEQIDALREKLKS